MENVAIDSNFTMLRFEVVDPLGKVVGTMECTVYRREKADKR